MIRTGAKRAVGIYWCWSGLIGLILVGRSASAAQVSWRADAELLAHVGAAAHCGTLKPRIKAMQAALARADAAIASGRSSPGFHNPYPGIGSALACFYNTRHSYDEADNALTAAEAAVTPDVDEETRARLGLERGIAEGQIFNYGAAMSALDAALSVGNLSKTLKAHLLANRARALLGLKRSDDANASAESAAAILPADPDVKEVVALVAYWRESRTPPAPAHVLRDAPPAFSRALVAMQPSGQVPPSPVAVQTISPARAIGDTHDCSKRPYPAEAYRNFESGQVLIRYTVRADGVISDVGVVKSSGYKALDDEAAACVAKQWRSTPATLDGKPMESPDHQALFTFGIK